MTEAEAENSRLRRVDAPSAENPRRTPSQIVQREKLAKKSDTLMGNDEESERFQVLKQIYSLEREANTDAEEWPDMITA